MMPIPHHTQILVVGGGPAGSFCAAALAREGHQVSLLEASKFPRYHIGESLLPAARPFLRFIDAEEKIISRGFCPKVLALSSHSAVPLIVIQPGAAFKLAQGKREGYNDFIALDPGNGAWNVIRSEFDEVLLTHASSCGVTVFEEVKVTSILFEGGYSSGRPICVEYERTPASSSMGSAETGVIHFDYLVDASGRSGIMAKKYLKNRRPNKSLDNIACWGYWTGCQRYSPGSGRENAVWIEALTDETGWVWFIPLHDGTVSVGIVQDQRSFTIKKRRFGESVGDNTLRKFYLDELARAPGALKLIGNDAKLVELGKDGGSGVKQAADFSYSSEEYAGPGYRLVGDASAFIDPLFSSGIHLAFAGALTAAATLSSSIKGDLNEEECAKWYNAKVGTAYNRFLLIVLGAYKQIRAQQKPVLSDFNEDNFDRAFDTLSPLLQGAADVDKKLTENEVQRIMDYIKGLLVPTDPEIQEAVKARVDPVLFSQDTLPSKDLLEEHLKSDEQAKLVIDKMKGQIAVYGMYDSLKDFTAESIDGWTVCIERGKLGLVRSAGV